MTGLIVRKEDGSLLFDTTKISYGLVKSGYMTYQRNWNRWVCTSNACRENPNNGANWTETGNRGDSAHGFSVSGARNPIVFIVGSGVHAGTTVSGDTMTFLYADATTQTKFYCFDLMRDGGTGPALRTFNEGGVLTFNSRQHPLNVEYSVTAPVRGERVNPADPNPIWFKTVYQGGTNIRFNSYTSNGISFLASVRSTVTIPIAGAGEVAAYLPWSRSVGSAHSTTVSIYEGSPVDALGLTEGVYGSSSSVVFTCTVGRTTVGGLDPYFVPITGGVNGAVFRDIPIDRYPTALIIKTAPLPFPFEF